MNVTRKECFLAVVVGLFCLTLMLIHYNYLTIKTDDYFVLAERSLFSKNSHLSWLKHLLFFNQTRWTYVGDFALFRPGLFFFQWLYFEILYPYGEKYVVAVLTLSNAVALIGIFFFLSRFTSALFALVGIIFIAIGQSGFIMFSWAHINPYLLGLGLFSWWLAIVREDRGWPSLLLFAAAFFHDLFGMILVSIALLRVIPISRNIFESKSIAVSDLVIVSSAVIFLCLRFYALTLIPAGSPELGGVISHYISSLSPDWVDALKQFCFDIASAISFNLLDGRLALIFASSVFLISLVTTAYRFVKYDDVLICALLGFFILFVLIIGGGRVMPRGQYGDWYGIYIQFGALCLWAIIFQARPLTRIPSFAVATILIFFSYQEIWSNSEWLRNQKNGEFTERAHYRSVVGEALGEEFPDRCLSGLIPGLVKAENEFARWPGMAKGIQAIPYREISILFADRMCDLAETHIEPLLLIAQDMKNFNSFDDISQIIDVEKLGIDANRHGFSAALETEATNYLGQLGADLHGTPGPQNWFEYFDRKTNQFKPSSKIEIIKSPGTNKFALLVEPIAEKGVALFNVAISFESVIQENPIHIFSLVNNDVFVWKTDPSSKKLELNAVGLIPFSSEQLSIQFWDSGEGICLLSLNGNIATAFLNCPEDIQNIVVIPLDNGTKSERVSLLLGDERP